MNKTELVRLLGKTEAERKIVKKTIDRMILLISDELADGQSVMIRDFGRFEPRPHKALMRRNPATGEEVWAEAKVGIGFVASDTLKKRVNGK